MTRPILGWLCLAATLLACNPQHVRVVPPDGVARGTETAAAAPSTPPADSHADAAPARSGTLTGLVVDRATRSPVEGVYILLESTNRGTLSDAAGRYRIGGLPDSAYTVVARRIGYETVRREGVRVAADSTVKVDLHLRAAPTQLSEVVIVQTGAMEHSARLGSAVAHVTAAYDRRDLEEADELVVIERPATADAPVRARSSARRGMGLGADEARPASEAPVTQGTLRARNADGHVVGEFPLRHTDVRAEISGYLARTVVGQRYENSFHEPIEAVYIFPLPAMAAVNDFVMEAGGRKVVGVVRPREEAERIYQAARARGQTASLLTQERPNIFTQNVANIEPGGAVTITITYLERLPYDHGRYEYVFPMVVGPRYQSQREMAAAGFGIRDSGFGSPAMPVRARDSSPQPNPESRIPNPGQINPPVLPPGARSGHDISLSVRLDAGMPVRRIEVVAHRAEVTSPTPERRVITLARGDSIPNRDFVLRWSAAGADTRFGVLAHRPPGGAGGAPASGYFTLAVQPPLAPKDEQVTPREITFIMDVSGSMMGVPIEISKQLVRRTLDRLRADDRFNIVYFASGNAQLWDRARPGTPENLESARRFLASVRAGGGTEMIAGLRRALSARHDPEFLQMYVFLTDGYVGEDQQILDIVKRERGDARFFGFGIGSSVNRFLIDGIGEHGGGMSQVVLPRDEGAVAATVDRLFDAIDSPVLVDVRIDWNGLPVRDVYPRQLRDLFAGQTLAVIGRYTAPARGTAYVHARVGRRHVRFPVAVDLPAERREHAALAPTWARHEIADLSADMLAAEPDDRRELERRITDLAVEYRLVSPFTAFVAVDESRIVGDGRPLRILQPVELPESVSYEGIFGERPVGTPVRVGAWGVTLQQTASGRVRVGAVDAGSAAAAAGVRAGAALVAADRAAIRSLTSLAGVLAQSGGRTVRVRLEPGGEAVLPAP